MADIRGVELLVLWERKPNEKGDSAKIRVVQWIVDRKAVSVKLERRTFFSKDGETRTGKAEGFTLKDMEIVKPRLDEIMDLMRNPPAAKQPEDGIEEVPF